MVSVPLRRGSMCRESGGGGNRTREGFFRRGLVLGGTGRKVLRRRRLSYAAVANFTSHARPARTLLRGLGVSCPACSPLVCSVELVETRDVLQTRIIARTDPPEHGECLFEVVGWCVCVCVCVFASVAPEALVRGHGSRRRALCLLSSRSAVTVIPYSRKRASRCLAPKRSASRANTCSLAAHVCAARTSSGADFATRSREARSSWDSAASSWSRKARAAVSMARRWARIERACAAFARSPG
jgi:hypothetical protein